MSRKENRRPSTKGNDSAKDGQRHSHLNAAQHRPPSSLELIYDRRGLMVGEVNGDGETFDTIRYQETLSAMDFSVADGAWLLRPVLAEKLLVTDEEEEETGDDGDTVIIDDGDDGNGGGGDDEDDTGDGRDDKQRRTTYRRLEIDTPLNWQNWYDFYHAVIQPLVEETGADVRLHLKLEARGELDVNLIDLSVKESVQQFNRDAEVEAE